MKKKILFGWSLNIIMLLGNNVLPVTEFRAAFKLTDPAHDIPAFTIFYQGIKTTSCRDGFFSVKAEQDQEPDTIGLLFTKSVHPKTDQKNTVLNLQIIGDQRYRYFKLFKDTSSQGWSFQEHALDADGKIGEDTIIVLIDPKYIDKLEVSPVSSRNLPTIVLRDIDKKKMARASDKSMLSAFNVSGIHENRQTKTMPMASGNGYVCLRH